jgi:hypothetical protein
MSLAAGSYEVTITRQMRVGCTPGPGRQFISKAAQRHAVNRVRPDPRAHPTHSPTTPSEWWMRAIDIIPVGDPEENRVLE